MKRNLNINIDPIEFNKTFYDDIVSKIDEILDTYRYLILYGGAGSSKSYTIAEILIYLSLKLPMFNLLVVRNTGRSNRDSTFALLKQIIIKWGLYIFYKINTSDMRITCTVTGNEIIFAGLDDVEKLKSVTFIRGELTDIWVEESSEVAEADFNQLDIRLRGKETKKHIWITFNPIDVNHWLKHRFIDDTNENVFIHHSTYKDNEHLDDDYKKLLESYKDSDPYYYDVYCLGNWGVLGNTVFDANKINQRLRTITEPISRGYFTYDYDGLHITNIKWNEQSNGFISIYKKPTNKAYVIGGDTAGEGSNYFVDQVLDQDGNQVAILRNQMDSDLYTKQTYCLGKYFNNALLTIEVNFDSYPIQELQRLGYNHMYIREVNDSALNKFRKSYGFRTDSWTRPAILNHLIELVREHTEFFNDKYTLEEMLTFIRNEKGRMEAQQGAHDDCVMSLAIAYEGMSQLRIKKERERQERDPRFEDGDYKSGLNDYWG